MEHLEPFSYYLFYVFIFPFVLIFNAHSFISLHVLISLVTHMILSNMFSNVTFHTFFFAVIRRYVLYSTIVWGTDPFMKVNDTF